MSMRPIVDAIAPGDGEQAADLVAHHIRHFYGAVGASTLSRAG
jgi:DNA-binding GntR family transcriptional regulator